MREILITKKAKFRCDSKSLSDSALLALKPVLNHFDNYWLEWFSIYKNFTNDLSYQSVLQKNQIYHQALVVFTIWDCGWT